MQHSDERQLLQKMQQGERAAMEQFYRQHVAYLFAVSRRYLANGEDAKDVLQESFIKIFSSIASFRPQENATLKSWATRIVVNNALNHLRDSRKMTIIDSEALPEDIPDEELDAGRLEAEEIQRMIEELPAGYRAVFNLFAIEQMSHKEIARLLGISESTSASQYHRAKRILKNKIKQKLSA